MQSANQLATKIISAHTLGSSCQTLQERLLQAACKTYQHNVLNACFLFICQIILPGCKKRSALLAFATIVSKQPRVLHIQPQDGHCHDWG